MLLPVPAHSQPAAATGSCCNPTTGDCSNGRTRRQCARPAVWTEAGVCGLNGVCIGACCSAPNGACSLTLASACSGSSWLFGAPCSPDTCTVCVTAWQSCEPCKTPGCTDTCCDGYSCQNHRYGKTFRSSFGRPTYVCMPERQCSAEGELCGNCYGGGACCDGLVCRWDHRRKVGVCSSPMSWPCTKMDAGCSNDDQCCPGCICTAGACKEVACDSNCGFSKRCKGEQARVCDAAAAAHASSA